MKKDGRAAGLNNKGFPLRKIVEKKEDLHVLECGHSLRLVSNAFVRSRRCPECAEQRLDVLKPIKNFIKEIQDRKRVTEFDTGEINIERQLPDGGYVRFSILNIQISYEEEN